MELPESAASRQKFPELSPTLDDGIMTLVYVPAERSHAAARTSKFPSALLGLTERGPGVSHDPVKVPEGVVLTRVSVTYPLL
jgi:hypothetical protein